MSDHVLFNSPAYGEEIANLVGTELPQRASSIARIRNGVLLGGVIYYNKFGNTSISAHAGSTTPYWLNRDMLFLIFDYPFRQLGVERMFAMTDESAQHELQFNLNIGFKEVTRIPRMFKRGAACVVLCMEREDCRFLNIKSRFIKTNIH